MHKICISKKLSQKSREQVITNASQKSGGDLEPKPRLGNMETGRGFGGEALELGVCLVHMGMFVDFLGMAGLTGI